MLLFTVPCPVTRTQAAKADLPEANDVADAVDIVVDKPGVGDVADQAPAGVTDTPEAGDTVDALSSR